MQNIQVTQVTPAVTALFDARMPSVMRAWLVLAGGIVGDILTDDVQAPTWAVVRERAFSSTFFAGALDAPRVQELITDLRKTGDVVVSVRADDPLIALLPTPYEYDGWALDYTDRPRNEGLDHLLAVPEGCEVRRMDAALFERSVDRDMNIMACGSQEKAVENLIGFFMMRGEEILCEAVAGPAVNGIREAGVITMEAQRKQGYATVTCAHLIRECERLGFETFWNCDKNNLPSNALAKKLGYRRADEFRVIAWFKSA
jgi:hypothetical protein